MLTNSSWQLLFGLFVMSASSLLQWNIETPNSDIAFSDPVPESGITNAASLAHATPGADSEFALLPDGGNVVSSVELVAQAASNGCGSNTRRLSRKMRARSDEMMCPIDGFQLNDDGKENVRQLLSPTVPNAQQSGDGPNSGGNGEPQRRLMFAPKDDTNAYFFVPKRNRPKQNSEICPEPMHSVPVCGRPSDAYDALMDTANSHLTIEPCYPYVPFVGCVPNTIGYCCLTADVAYASDDLTQSERDLWTNLLSTSNKLKSIDQGLTAGLRNLYKLVGLSCIPMATTASEQGQEQGIRPF